MNSPLIHIRNVVGLAGCCAIAVATTALAADEFPPIDRVLPPQGMEIPAEVQERLTKQLKTPDADPDVEIFRKAVDYALQHQEFYGPKDFEKADRLLAIRQERADALAKGESPWKAATGLVVRGYTSSVDGSAQPYGLVIPQDLQLGKEAPKVPLYIFLHGRGDKSTDLHFIDERLRSAGQIQPPGAIVLHPFGRQCVGYKSAGEIDVLEAVQHVIQNYPVDPNRVVMMGFSMGGAGAWHLGAHYAPHWRVVAPGAGFAETARYTNTKPDAVPVYERTLWGCYDVPDYVRNLFNVRTIAYSGELDKQIQAARVMEEAFAAEGQKLEHRIGPGVPHKYEPGTLKQLLKDIAEELEKPRSAVPETVYWQSRTLRYADSVAGRYQVLSLDDHWQDSQLTATKSGAVIATKNIHAFRAFPPHPETNTITVDGETFAFRREAPNPFTFVKTNGKWALEDFSSERRLAKTPGLQGPIDDAFLSSFLIVLPTGKPKAGHEKADAWAKHEAEHFISRWRALMRGDARVKKDTEVTADDIQQHNLILWGDENTNALIAKFVQHLPVKFAADSFELAGKSYTRDKHVPVLIYPNPAAPKKYIVLNSGLTFREGHDRTNSQQNPKLPDWAVLDISTPPSATAAGKVVAADFFDERWQVKK